MRTDLDRSLPSFARATANPLVFRPGFDPRGELAREIPERGELARWQRSPNRIDRALAICSKLAEHAAPLRGQSVNPLAPVAVRNRRQDDSGVEQLAQNLRHRG